MVIGHEKPSKIKTQGQSRYEYMKYLAGNWLKVILLSTYVFKILLIKVTGIIAMISAGKNNHIVM